MKRLKDIVIAILLVALVAVSYAVIKSSNDFNGVALAGAVQIAECNVKYDKLTDEYEELAWSSKRTIDSLKTKAKAYDEDFAMVKRYGEVRMYWANGNVEYRIPNN